MTSVQLKQIPILCALFVAITNSSWADSPSAMLLWKKERDAFMEMNCSPISEVEIECKSITTMLLKTDDDETIEEKWTSSGLPNYFYDDGTIKEESLAEFSFCNGPQMEYLRFFISALDGNFDISSFSVPINEDHLEEAKNKIAKMHLIEKKDIADQAEAILNFCNSKTMKAFYEIAKLEHEKEIRTCNISSQHVTERYKKIRENLWVYRTDPDFTPCRRIKIMTLEKPENGEFWEWSFRQEQLSLDKDASWFGINCGKTDGIEEYENHIEPVFWGCDYIKP